MSQSRFRKLLNMSSKEVVFRAGEIVGRLHEEGYYALGLHRNPEADLLEKGQTGIPFEMPWIDPADQDALSHALQSQHIPYVQTLCQSADRICENRFTFFGFDFDYGSKILWCADPVSRNEWPMKFHTKVDIFSGDRGYGDVKYVWELSRFQFLPTLGKAYVLTKDEKYARHGLELIENWIQANPYKVGINWASALEVSVRSLSWCWALSFFENAKSFSIERRNNILRSLYQHGVYLEDHLSFYFSPYNHLIGEATALFALGVLFPGLRPAQTWLEKGWQILEEEMPKQFHADGGTVEQAFGYHHFTIGFYLQALLLRRKRGLKVLQETWSLFEKTFEFSLHVMRPDGSVPMTGDGDEGKAFDLSQPSLWDFRPLISIGASMFGRGDFKQMAGPIWPDATWMIGQSGWKQYQELKAEVPVESSKALSKSGYYIMRTGWDREAHYLNFDCGEISDGVPEDDSISAAHGHADLLSFELSSFGKALLVDPGFYTYNGEVKWHRYFRETEAHNAVVVDGVSQAEYRGRLKWSNGPRATLEHWLKGKSFDYVKGSHTGYLRLPNPVVHRRSIAFLKPDYWFLRDEFSGEGTHQIDRYFHFAPVDVDCDFGQSSVYTRGSKEGGLAIIGIEKEDVTVEIFQNGEAPEAGWLAPGYDKKVLAPVARYRTKAVLPFSLHTLLIPFKGESSDIHVKADILDLESENGSAQVFTIDRGADRDIIVFSSGKELISFNKGWQTDGQMAWVRLNNEGEIINCGIIDGSSLLVNGQNLLTLSRKIRSAVLSFANKAPDVELSESVEVSSDISNLTITVDTTPC